MREVGGLMDYGNTTYCEHSMNANSITSSVILNGLINNMGGNCI